PDVVVDEVVAGEGGAAPPRVVEFGDAQGEIENVEVRDGPVLVGGHAVKPVPEVARVELERPLEIDVRDAARPLDGRAAEAGSRGRRDWRQCRRSARCGR